MERDTVSFNSAISACEKRGEWQFAFVTLSTMPLANVETNAISYNAAISACEKGGKWQLALDLLSTMAQETAFVSFLF